MSKTKETKEKEEETFPIPLLHKVEEINGSSVLEKDTDTTKSGKENEGTYTVPKSDDKMLGNIPSANTTFINEAPKIIPRKGHADQEDEGNSEIPKEKRSFTTADETLNNEENLYQAFLEFQFKKIEKDKQKEINEVLQTDKRAKYNLLQIQQKALLDEKANLQEQMDLLKAKFNNIETSLVNVEEEIKKAENLKELSKDKQESINSQFSKAQDHAKELLSQILTANKEAINSYDFAKRPKVPEMLLYSDVLNAEINSNLRASASVSFINRVTESKLLYKIRYD